MGDTRPQAVNDYEMKVNRVSDTPKTSAWWRECMDDENRQTDMRLMLDDLAASERSDAIHLEALAESERLRVECAGNRNADGLALVKMITRAEKAEQELYDLRATFDRTVAAWKREELSWDEERKKLTAERDDLLREIGGKA